jgi:hypothetical protein
MVYYRRQLYLYKFTIVEGSSTEKLLTGRVYSYCWTEEEFDKGSNEIASALYDRIMKTNLTNKKTFRIIADGCGGQNKNCSVNVMCCLLQDFRENGFASSKETAQKIFDENRIPPEFKRTRISERKRLHDYEGGGGGSGTSDQDEKFYLNYFLCVLDQGSSN